MFEVDRAISPTGRKEYIFPIYSINDIHITFEFIERNVSPTGLNTSGSRNK